MILKIIGMIDARISWRASFGWSSIQLRNAVGKIRMFEDREYIIDKVNLELGIVDLLILLMKMERRWLPK